MATLLLAAGTKGKRYALPNSRVMMHQPTGGATGQTSDISIAAKEILRWRARMNELISSHTNKTSEEIANDSDRDFYLTAEDALAYGIVDKVIEAKPIGK
jgi:ATP-dependent Clp protease protease subunit